MVRPMNPSIAPLLTLVMIVKNEAKSLPALLDSVRNAIDSFAIVDTGSTDETLSILFDRQILSMEVDGDIRQLPFIDFATTRNESLKLAEELGAEFGLIMSGDETLVGGAALREFCRQAPAALEAANVLVESGGVKFESTRLVRLNTGWRFVSESGVHEVLMKEGQRAEICVPGVKIIHAESDPERKRSRLYRDLEMLRNQIARNPTDTRAWFYTAQTLDDLGLRAQAFETYKRRIQLDGYAEEIYESIFRMARIALMLGKPWPEAQQLYLDAHTADPRRAEPLFEIASLWRTVGNWPLTYLFASRGAEMPYPNGCKLFVQDDVYRWKLADLAVIAENPRLKRNVEAFEADAGQGPE